MSDKIRQLFSAIFGGQAEQGSRRRTSISSILLCVFLGEVVCKCLKAIFSKINVWGWLGIILVLLSLTSKSSKRKINIQ